MNKPSKYDIYIQRLKNHPILAIIFICFAALVGAGAVISSISSIRMFISDLSDANKDPYIFEYNNQKITFSGGNGSSIEQAITITGALGSDAAISAEYYFIKTFFKNYKTRAQSVIFDEKNTGKLYDVLILESPKGNKREVFFDISNFFGTPGTDGRIEDKLKETSEKHKKTNNGVSGQK